MMRRVVEVDGKRYEVSYVEFDDYVEVYGGHRKVLVNKYSFSTEKAITQAVRTLVRTGAIHPLDSEEPL